MSKKTTAAASEDYVRGEQGTNSKYSAKGMLGSYRSADEQFQNPDGVQLFAGFGADETDLVRGFCEPNIAERPAYDKANYAERWTEPSSSDFEDAPDMSDATMREDYEFRMKERVSKGFFTRPRIPTER